MKILYVRKKDDVYLKGLIKVFQGNEIYILDQMNFSFFKYENNEFISIFKFKKKYKNNYINYLLRILFGIYFLLKNKVNYDITHLLNIKRENFFLIPYFSQISKKIFLSIYGRSTYTNRFKRFFFKYFYCYFNIIYFQNKSVLQEFSVFNKDVSTLLKVQMFPLIIFDGIEKIKNKNLDLLNIQLKIGIKSEKIKISCSTTIAAYDQHYKIINSLKGINNKENVQLMFLLTYGGSKLEKDNIINKINSDLCDFDKIIFTEFFSEEELSVFRLSSDIFINMRTSDQFAGAMLESIYSGSMIITADWLKYEILDELGIKYFKVKDFNELTSILNYCIENNNDLKFNYSLHNIKIMDKEYNFEKISKQFLEYYNTI